MFENTREHKIMIFVKHIFAPVICLQLRSLLRFFVKRGPGLGRMKTSAIPRNHNLMVLCRAISSVNGWDVFQCRDDILIEPFAGCRLLWRRLRWTRRRCRVTSITNCWVTRWRMSSSNASCRNASARQACPNSTTHRCTPSRPCCRDPSALYRWSYMQNLKAKGHVSQ